MDNRQYRQIVDAYADMVYRIALNQTRPGADAEDVVQAVFLKFYEKPPTWFCDGPERNGGRALAAVPEREPARDDRLRAWLIRVTVNECKSLWRSLWRQRVELRDIRDGRCSSLRGARFRRHVPRGAVRGVGRATREVPHRGAPALLRGHGYPRDRRGAGHQGAHGAHPARPSKEVTETVTEGGVGR